MFDELIELSKKFIFYIIIANKLFKISRLKSKDVKHMNTVANLKDIVFYQNKTGNVKIEVLYDN